MLKIKKFSSIISIILCISLILSSCLNKKNTKDLVREDTAAAQQNNEDTALDSDNKIEDPKYSSTEGREDEDSSAVATDRKSVV